MWAPALLRALAGQYQPHKAFCRPWELGSASPSPLPVGAVGGAGPGHRVPGTKGPFMPTRHHLISGPDVMAALSWGGRSLGRRRSSEQGDVGDRWGPQSSLCWCHGRGRSASAGPAHGSPAAAYPAPSEAQGKAGPSTPGLGAQDGPAPPTGAHDGRCARAPCLLTLLSCLTHTHSHTAHAAAQILHSHTAAYTRPHAPAHTFAHVCTHHTQMLAREHTHPQTRLHVRQLPMQPAQARTAHVCTHTLAHPQALVRTLAHACTHHTSAREYMSAHTHICIHKHFRTGTHVHRVRVRM